MLPMVRGQQIKHIRLRMRMSQPQFAGLLGVSPLTVSRWELGRAKPEGSALTLLIALQDQIRQRDAWVQQQNWENIKGLIGVTAAGVALAALLEALFGKGRK